MFYSFLLLIPLDSMVVIWNYFMDITNPTTLGCPLYFFLLSSFSSFTEIFLLSLTMFLDAFFTNFYFPAIYHYNVFGSVFTNFYLPTVYHYQWESLLYVLLKSFMRELELSYKLFFHRSFTTLTYGLMLYSFSTFLFSPSSFPRCVFFSHSNSVTFCP